MWIRIVLAVVLLAILAFGVRLVVEARNSRQMSADVGLVDGRLRSCPERPNCVSSEGATGEQRVEPLVVSATAWEGVEAALTSVPGVTIVERDDDYLHATCRSSLLGFVDDLELHRTESGVAVRSASRVGYSDLGANRRRVQAIRTLLATP